MNSTDAVDQRVRQSLFDRSSAPREIELLLRAGPFHRLGKLHQTFGRVRTPVEDHVLDVLEQVFGNVLVDNELTGVDDAHVHAGIDRVKQERGVHRLANDVVAAEREREVADAAADLHAGQAALMSRVASM